MIKTSLVLLFPLLASLSGTRFFYESWQWNFLNLFIITLGAFALFLASIENGLHRIFWRWIPVILLSSIVVSAIQTSGMYKHLYGYIDKIVIPFSFILLVYYCIYGINYLKNKPHIFRSLKNSYLFPLYFSLFFLACQTVSFIFGLINIGNDSFFSRFIFISQFTMFYIVVPASIIMTVFYYFFCLIRGGRPSRSV